MMNTFRENSLDSINLTGWRWEPFLDYVIKSLGQSQLESYPINSNFLQHQEVFGSKSKKEKASTQTWAAKTTKFRQIRAACVEAGSAASVLNLVINPMYTFDLPFF